MDLEALYAKGSKRPARANHFAKVTRILTALDVAAGPQDLSLPAFRIHQLKGDQLDDYWSVWMNGNWRITFRFTPSHDVELVDYQDYH
ncbi:MAG: type II toxin-antitoxin system RelE/ParE family toxin [Micrococcales bacterium]|nr:type II toxin-antitoxin system RelE/ParE family toxin [Micrococcales bacterium]